MKRLGQIVILLEMMITSISVGSALGILLALAAGRSTPVDDPQLCSGCLPHLTVTAQTRTGVGNWTSVIPTTYINYLGGAPHNTAGVCGCPPKDDGSAPACTDTDPCSIYGMFELIDPSGWTDYRFKQGANPFGSYIALAPDNQYPWAYAGCNGGRVDTYEFRQTYVLLPNVYLQIAFDMSCDGCAGPCPQ